MNYEEQVVNLIRRIIDESKLTVVHQSGSIIDIDEDKRDNEIENVVHNITEVLDTYYLFLDNEEDIS